jgi:hypothetical protein
VSEAPALLEADRSLKAKPGGLAQLARAPALHAGGQRFESVILHSLSSFKHRGCNRNQAVDWFKANYITKVSLYASSFRGGRGISSLTYWKSKSC